MEKIERERKRWRKWNERTGRIFLFQTILHKLWIFCVGRMKRKREKERREKERKSFALACP